MKKVFNVFILVGLIAGLQVLFMNYSYGQAGDAPTTSNLKPASIVPSGTADGSSRCVVICPPEGVDEGEPCGLEYNDGCNMGIPQFTPVNPNEIICGEAWFDGATRDTDWFEMQITGATTVTMTLYSDAQSFVFGLVGQTIPGVPGCDNVTGSLSSYAIAPGCTETSIEVTLEPGTYYFFVGLDFAGPLYQCGARAGVTYTATFSSAPAVPLPNWPIYLGILLISAFMVFRFRRRLA
ncbi:MAG: hypothetical protein L3J66_07910 [Bacteroidales bacterium]|nr:hypothetical protein [Bacteroidales bacterium]